MKDLYKMFYIIGGAVLLMVILGGSLTKPAFSNMAERTLQTAGMDKSRIDSVDASIDEMYYKMNQVMLQIEKLKNFLTDKKTDDSRYQKEKKELLSRAVYEPIREVVIFLYRIMFLCIALFILAAGGIAHIFWKHIELRRRVAMLENTLQEIR